MRTTVEGLAAHAIAHSLFRQTTLEKAVERLGFVQADPIRSPARAQDLILRNRVKDYRVGDLDSQYGTLGFEERFLYAYGFMPQSTWQLLHPRFERKLTAREQRVLDLVASRDRLHPRELEAFLGRRREVNGWGGFSKATTRTLHRLHREGRLRVVGRENGVRVYQVSAEQRESIEPEERLGRLILLVANLLAPIPERSLRATLQQIRRYYAHSVEGMQSVLTRLVQSDALRATEVDGLRYLWPAGPLRRAQAGDTVRFLAPFDPLVWDRRRFAHLWGWAYRFEAYTPIAQRQRGYSAMPLLWRNRIIGWANASTKSGKLMVETGFVESEPKEPEFRQALEAEVSRLETFLQTRDKA
jgi:uncharacterized protein